MEEFPPIIADIIRDCLQFDPAARPTANDIAERLVRWQFREIDLDRDEEGNTELHRLAAADASELSLLPLRNHDTPMVFSYSGYRDKSLKPMMINAENHLGETSLMVAKTWSFIKRLCAYQELLPGNKEPSNIAECFHNIDVCGSLRKLAERQDVEQITQIVSAANRFTCAYHENECLDGETPLHTAARFDNVELIEALMDLRAIDIWKLNNEGRTVLHVAALHGHTSIMERLLEVQNVSGKERDVGLNIVNTQDKFGKTALHLAAASGNASAVKVLLNCSATKANLRDFDELVPVFDAILMLNVDVSSQLEMFKPFLDHPGFNVNEKFSCGETILHEIARRDLSHSSRFLLQHSDLKPSERQKAHLYTPVHLAVRERSFGVADMLLAMKDVNVNAVDKYGNTVLHILAAMSPQGFVCTDTLDQPKNLITFTAKLVAREDINLNVYNVRGDTPLHVAIQNKNDILVKVLLSGPNKKIITNATNIKNDTPLHLAVNGNMRSIVKTILSCGDADVNARDERHRTPLHHAASRNYVKVAAMLLSRNDVDVNARDDYQETPLHFALKNAVEVAKLLLSRSDVDVNARNDDQRTPLHKACDRIDGSVKVAELLLSRSDIDINARDEEDKTPMHIACGQYYAELVKLFVLRSDVDVNARDTYQDTPLHSACYWGGEVAKVLLSRSDVDVNARDRKQQTPLHRVCDSIDGSVKVAKAFLSRSDVDVNARDGTQRTPLHIACNGNRTTTEIAKLLVLRSDVDVNARDGTQQTPLHTACRYGRVEVAKALLSRSDVDVNARNNSQQTPLHRACYIDAAEVAKLLLSRSDVDVNACDVDGKTALEVATAEDSSECNELLERAVSTDASK